MKTVRAITMTAVALVACGYIVIHGGHDALAGMRTYESIYGDANQRYVIAESKGKLYRAPVRQAHYGLQVLVPKHGWQYCELTCSYTLRKYYLEFWDYQSDHFIGLGRFRFDF